MTIVNGWEPSAFESFMAGADGWFARMTNVIPRQCVEREKSHVCVAHAALDLMGRPLGPPRRPRRPLSPEDRGRLERILLEYDLLDRR